MRGASATAESLRNYKDARVRVFTVWEPVLDTDKDEPTPQVLAHIKMGRSKQYWDSKRSVSDALKAVFANDNVPTVGKASLTEGDIVWDVAAIYPAGVKWNGAPPKATFKGAPVQDVQQQIRGYLASAQ